MKKLNYLFCALVAFVISTIFFDSSIIIMSFIFAGLNAIDFTSKETYVIKKKKPTILYGIVLGACLSGGILLILGKKVINNDTIIITGAMLFAPTISGLLLFHLNNLIVYVKNEKLKTKK